VPVPDPELPPLLEPQRPPRQRLAPAVTLAAGAVCAVVGGVQLGGKGVVSAVLAVLVVTAFFWSGLVPLLLARGQAAGFSLVVLLLNYALRLVLVLALLRVAARLGAVDARTVGVSVVVCALAWTGAQGVALARA
jgi:hypothetical protein